MKSLLLGESAAAWPAQDVEEVSVGFERGFAPNLCPGQACPHAAESDIEVLPRFGRRLGAKEHDLGAFIRERSKVPREQQNHPPEDVNAALRVFGRLLPRSDVLLNLRDADLRNTDLRRLPKHRVLLEGANLEGTRLPQDA
jgi:hypothetical protein